MNYAFLKFMNWGEENQHLRASEDQWYIIYKTASDRSSVKGT